MTYQTDDLRILAMKEVSPPDQLLTEFPLSENASRCVFQARQEIQKVLRGEDDRLVVVVGPCSIHDPRCGPRLCPAPACATPQARQGFAADYARFTLKSRVLRSAGRA